MSLFKLAQVVTKNLCYICVKICYQTILKIAQSGQTFVTNCGHSFTSIEPVLSSQFCRNLQVSKALHDRPLSRSFPIIVRTRNSD